MGKWCEVKCNCQTNRADGARAQKESINCVHQGIYLQFWPGDLLTIGLVLPEIFGKRNTEFTIFPKIANWRNYDDEYLCLSSDEVQLWELEIIQLKLYLSGEQSLDWKKRQRWQAIFQETKFLYGDLEKTLDDGLKFIQASKETGQPIEFYW
jgi:hypothetical protein